MNPKFLRKKSPPFASNVIRIDSYNYLPQLDQVFREVENNINHFGADTNII